MYRPSEIMAALDGIHYSQMTDELLILSKGVARLPERGKDGEYNTFTVGAYLVSMY